MLLATGRAILPSVTYRDSTSRNTDGRPFRRVEPTRPRCPGNDRAVAVHRLCDRAPCPRAPSCRTSSACTIASRSRSCAAVRGNAASARARSSSGRLRFRSVDTIVQAALESYRNTGFNEISLLSLSSSDYPHFEELVLKLKALFGPLGVNISVPSLRVNDQLRTIAELIGNTRRSSLTLAPEVARDDMREQIRKRIKNDDLFEGCASRFPQQFRERQALLHVRPCPASVPSTWMGSSKWPKRSLGLAKRNGGVMRRSPPVFRTSSPKRTRPTNGMPCRRASISHWAHEYLWQKKSLRCVQLKRHDIDTSMLEGVISRGDRRVGDAIELAWQRGARMDSWTEQFDAERWWTAIADAGLDAEQLLHQPFDVNDRLPWDHVNVKYGRTYLEKEQLRSVSQLAAMQPVV